LTLAVGLGIVAGAIGLIAAVLAPLLPLFKAVAVGCGLIGVAATTAFSLIMRTLPFAHILTVAFLFRDKIVAAFNWVRDRIVQAFNWVRDRVVGVWNSIWAAVSSVAGKIRDFFKNLPGNIAGWIGAVARTLWRKGKDIIGGFLDGIKAGAHRIKKWFTDLPGNIWDWIGFGSPPAWAIQGGRFIIEGLLKGMTNKIGTVKKWLGDQFGSLLGGVLSGIGGLFTGGPQGTSARSNAMLGRQMAQSFGWTGGQWEALNKLVMSESGWSNTAQNPTSTAYGIGQFLNSTWASVGASKTSDPGAQIAAMLRYIRSRYGDPASAWAFKQTHNWYGTGGVVPGAVGTPQVAVVHGGEAVFRPDQARWLSASSRGGGTTINNISFAGAIISSAQEAERWVVDALRRAGENGRPITIRGRRL